MARIAAAAIAALLLFATASHAEIYRWEDEAGTVHFTDDVTNIPEALRGKSSVVIREAPDSGGPSKPAEPDRTRETFTAASPEDRQDATTGGENEDPASLLEQLKSKIAAKESFVKMVEERQNLVLNPDRRRVLNPGDLELYKKYQAELPRDRERLRELELLTEPAR